MKRLSELLRNGVYDVKYYMQLNKKGAAVAPPTVAPTPAVEEASVEITDEEKKKKLDTGKKELKIPLATSSDTALKTDTNSKAGSSLKM